MINVHRVEPQAERAALVREGQEGVKGVRVKNLNCIY